MMLVLPAFMLLLAGATLAEDKKEDKKAESGKFFLIRSGGQSDGQSDALSQSVRRTVGQYDGRSVSTTDGRSVRRTVGQSDGRSVSPTVGQSVRRRVGQSDGRSVSPTQSRSVRRTLGRSTVYRFLESRIRRRLCTVFHPLTNTIAHPISETHSLDSGWQLATGKSTV